MIQVQYNLRMLPAEFLGVSDSALCHVAQQSGVGVSASALAHLKDHRRLLFSSSLDDSLQLFHIVEVEGGDSVTAFDSLGKHLTGVDQAEFFVANHCCGYYIIIYVYYRFHRSIDLYLLSYCTLRGG